MGCAHRPLAVAPAPSRKPVTDWVPQNMTSKLFVPKTAEMNEGFLIFDKLNGATGMTFPSNSRRRKSFVFNFLSCLFIYFSFFVSSERRAGRPDALSSGRWGHVHSTRHAIRWFPRRPFRCGAADARVFRLSAINRFRYTFVNRVWAMDR